MIWEVHIWGPDAEHIFDGCIIFCKFAIFNTEISKFIFIKESLIK